MVMSNQIVPDIILSLNQTRFNELKLLKPICKIKPRTHDFPIRTINYWKKLQNDVVCASFLSNF